MVVSPSLPQSARRPRAGSAELALLRGHPVFGALEPGQLEQLVSYARTRRVAAGTTLFSKGDPGTELFAVSAGTVKISVPAPDGREAMFNLLELLRVPRKSEDWRWLPLIAKTLKFRLPKMKPLLGIGGYSG